MSAMDELYARALQLRDCMMPGCSVEKSKAEAEKLFLELGQQGHVKAMHNYAVLQQKKGKYKLAMDWYDKSGLDASKANIRSMRECGQIKEDLVLVLGNNRSIVGITGSPIMDAYFGTSVDMLHLRSFGGNATTCHFKQCAMPGAKHITVADPLSYNFAKRYNLKHVLMEGFPTFNPVKPKLFVEDGPVVLGERDTRRFESDAKVNYFGAVVQNLSKAMESGAILEIDWDPSTTQWCLSREESEDFHVCNPFHAFIHVHAAICGVQCMYSSANASEVPQELRAMAREYSDRLSTEIEFLHRQGVGKSLQELYERIYAETEVYARMIYAAEPDQPPLLAFLEADLHKDPTDKVVTAVANAEYRTFPPHYVAMPCPTPDGKEITHNVDMVLNGRKGLVYSTNTIFANSLFGLTAISLCVQNNIPYAKRYLESIGFVDVVIERRTNTHNGRKNVWMVRAVKA